MSGIETNDFSAPDDVRTPDRTTVEVVKIAGAEVGRYTFQPGWRWSECVKPVAGTGGQGEHSIEKTARQLGIPVREARAAEARALDRLSRNPDVARLREAA